MFDKRRGSRRWRWATLLLVVCLPLSGCALFGASSLWWVVLLLLGSAVALASGPKRAGNNSEAPVAVSASAERAATTTPQALGKCSGWVHKSCAGNKIVGSCCPANAKCNYRRSIYADCGKGTCISGTSDRAMCPHPKSKQKTAKDCAKRHGMWRQTCHSGTLGMECLPGMPTNFAGPLSRIYPQLRFARCAKPPDPKCAPSKAQCKTPKGNAKGKRR